MVGDLELMPFVVIAAVQCFKVAQLAWREKYLGVIGYTTVSMVVGVLVVSLS
jgi:hypothetical protein